MKLELLILENYGCVLFYILEENYLIWNEFYYIIYYKIIGIF